MDLFSVFQSWAGSEDATFKDVTILGNNIGVKFFFYEHTPGRLTDVEGKLLSEKYGKEIFNVLKVVGLGHDYKGPLEVGDLISLLDESLDAIPDLSMGAKADGTPNAGFIPLGRLVPFTYLANKLATPKQDLYFIISPAWVSVRHNNLENLLTQAKASNS